MSKQPPPAPTCTTSAVGPCPTVIQIVGRPSTGSLPSTIALPDHPPITKKVSHYKTRPNHSKHKTSILPIFLFYYNEMHDRQQSGQLQVATMLTYHKQIFKRTTMKNQNRNAALGRSAMKLLGGGGGASTSFRSTIPRP